ncbi:MAG TPA: glycerol kinase GlpK [Acidimicrobiales bacterium]|jgi:glycerol kinase|nr:glycerol kinase GlpK [Acidimicrobiales bacterium]
MRNVVAIDAGTTGVRALVVDEAARVVDVAYREVTQHFPRPGWVEHDPDEIWAAVRATLAEVGGRLAESGATVAAIGITNQRETLVAFDRASGRPLHNAIVWQDRRTAALCAELERAGHLPLVRQRTGLILDSYFTASKITYLLRSGDLALSPDSPTLAFGTVDSWVLWNLTGGTAGGVFATDPSNASRTMLLNTETLQWSDELCQLFEVPPHTLPELHPSAGRFGLAALGDLGPAGAVLDGVPVSAVLGDQQAALFGQACFDPGLVKVTYGTGSFVLANAGPDRPAAPDGLTVSVAWDLDTYAGPGRLPVAYALEGSTFVSGAAIQWLRDGLGIIASADEVGPLAESVGDSGGVTFVPALTGLGSPWWDPDARGTITGITRGAGRAQFARACVEAMAFQVRDMTDAMAAASAYPLSALRADGGAAAMDLLLQLQAEQSRMPVARPQSLESTGLGAATLAGLVEGMWGSLDDLAGRWSASARFEPELPVELTDAVYAVWRRAVERSRGWARPATAPGAPEPA